MTDRRPPWGTLPLALWLAVMGLWPATPWDVHDLPATHPVQLADWAGHAVGLALAWAWCRWAARTIRDTTATKENRR